MLVDTSVWSLALRRDRPTESAEVDRLRQLLLDGDAIVTGVVLQELLQGVVDGTAKERLVGELVNLPLLVPARGDHQRAAEIFTTCRRRGVHLPTVDALLAALCVRRDLTLLTTDTDFRHAAPLIGLSVWGTN